MLKTGIKLILTLAFISDAYSQDRSLGLRFMDDGAYRSIPLASPPFFGTLPLNIDWTADFPSPGNQGKQSSCVGWAVSYLKSFQEQRERNWGILSGSHMFSPSYIYNQIKIGNCGGGAVFSDALALVRYKGASLLADFQYDENSCSSLPSALVLQNARQYSIAEWRRVNVQDPIEIKSHLAGGFPILIGANVDNSFINLKGTTSYKGPTSQSRGGHAMVVIGYDDNRNAFKLINSWGTDWGSGGFGWIDYESFRKIVVEGYVVQDVIAAGPLPAPMPVPPPVPAPRPVPTPAPQPIPSNSPKNVWDGPRPPIADFKPPLVGANEELVQEFHSLLANRKLDKNAFAAKFPTAKWNLKAGTEIATVLGKYLDLNASASYTYSSSGSFIDLQLKLSAESLTHGDNELLSMSETLSQSICGRMWKQTSILRIKTGQLNTSSPTRQERIEALGMAVQYMMQRTDYLCKSKNLGSRCTGTGRNPSISYFKSDLPDGDQLIIYGYDVDQRINTFNNAGAPIDEWKYRRCELDIQIQN